MKKSVLLGAGLILIGVFLLLGVQKNTLASHDPNANYDPALGVGTPEDSVADSTPDKPGSDFDNDRTPDRTAGDRGTTDAGDNLRDRSPNSDRDGNRDDGPAGGQNGAPDRSAQQSRNKDRTPDCGDGPGDGSCGNSPASGDDRRDNFGAGDDLEDEIPDRPRAINRVGDNVSDESPDRTNEEGYLADNGMPLTINDRRGARDCATADQAVGECDNNTTNQIDDNFEDRVGRSGSEDWALDGSGSDATPDKNIAAESDNPNRPARDGDSFGSQGDGTASRISAAIRDGAPDKTASRPRTNGWHNHSQAARDTFQEGARDYSPDNKSDQGSLGFAALAVSTADETSGGEGAAGSTGPAGAKGSDGDTCSFVAGSSSDPMKTGAQLGLLLGPLALVWMIRNRKKGGRMNKGVSLGLGALLISGGLLMAGPAQAAHDPQAGFNPAFSGAPQDDVADHIADRPGSDKMNMDRNPDRTSRDRNTADAGDGNEDRSQNMDNESPFRDDGPAGGQNGTPDRTGNRDGGGAQSPGPGVNGSNRPGGVRDATPDCGNGPGDGNCGNGPSAGDNTQDNFGAGDDLADNSPDRPIGFNRIGDDVGDELPEKAHSDRLIILNGGTLVRDRVNARDCNAEDVAQGECDDRLANNPDEGFRDRVGREGNNHDWTLDGKNRLGIPDKDISGADDPRRVARDGNSNGAGCDFNCGDGVPSGKPSQVADRAILGLSDGMPDGVMSRDRDSGFANHNQASRDAFATGAGDRARDDRPDEGSLGFGDPSIPSAANEGTVGPGGGPGPQGETGDDGCSFAANGTTNPLKAGIFMAILLAPLALIWIRRQKLTRSAMKITAWFGGALLVFGIGAGTGMTGEAHAAHNPMDNFDSTQELGWPGDEVGDSDSDQDKPGYDRFEDGRPDRPNEDSTPSGVSDRSSNMDNTPSTDGTPDGTPSRDRVAPRSRVTDGSPDCGDEAGDGQCGTRIGSPFASDSRADNFSAGEGISDSTPDRPMVNNRMGDEAGDDVSDRPNSDEYLAANGMTLTVGDRVGARDCNPQDLAGGECDDRTTNQFEDNFPDTPRSGLTHHDWTVDGRNQDGTPDKVTTESDNPNRPARDGDANGSNGDLTASRVAAANQDGVPDWAQDRNVTGDLRERGNLLHTAPYRSRPLEGANDNSPDNTGDGGDLGFGVVLNPNVQPTAGPDGPTGSTGSPGLPGQEGDDGCSFAASGGTHPAKPLGLLMVLLAPLAAVRLRRWIKQD